MSAPNITVWQGKSMIARCSEIECGREELRATTMDDLKAKVRRHLRQCHAIRDEPVWNGG